MTNNTLKSMSKVSDTVNISDIDSYFDKKVNKKSKVKTTNRSAKTTKDKNKNVKFYITNNRYEELKKSKMTLTKYLEYKIGSSENMQLDIETMITRDRESYRQIYVSFNLYKKLETIAEQNFTTISRAVTAILENCTKKAD